MDRGKKSKAPNSLKPEIAEAGLVSPKNTKNRKVQPEVVSKFRNILLVSTWKKMKHLVKFKLFCV